MPDFYKEARDLHEKKQYEKALKLYEQGIAAGDAKCWYGYAIFLKNGYVIKIIRRKGVLVRGFFLKLFLYKLHRQNQSLFGIGSLPKF